MSRRTQTRQPAPRRIAVLVAVAALAALVLSFIGPPSFARYAAWQAARDMDQWALSAAERWLDSAARFAPGEGELDLMRAACNRRRGRTDGWRNAMDAAVSKAVASTSINLEITLSLIRVGERHEWIEDAQIELVRAGVSPDDVATSCLDSYLARGDLQGAEQFLQQWESAFPERPHVEYLWGFFWMQLDDYDQALERFEHAVARLPSHELARKMIAELYETQGRLDRAAEQHLESVRRSPTSDVARLGLARTLRKLNSTAEARDLLEPLVTKRDPLPQAIHEMGQLELESGNYEQAKRWRLAAPPDQTDQQQLLEAAVVAHLVNDQPRAAQLIERSDAVAAQWARSYFLQTRLLLDPEDRAAAEELQQLQLPAPTSPSSASGRGAPAGPGPKLFARHCSCCHGSQGGGDGRGSRHLFPPARDFRNERFRIVSAGNAVVSLSDLERIIEHGMPGTSMPSFADLSQHDRELLAEEVLRLHRSGVRDRVFTQLTQDDDAFDETEVSALVQQLTTAAERDETEVSALVQQLTTAAERVEVPRIEPDDAAGIERGKQVYAELACHQCHGADGRGAVDLSLVDELLRPTRPRDLVHDPLKGGSDPDSVYLRLYLGMPGTPHPASPSVPASKLADLARYCLSLSQGPPRKQTNYQRRRLVYWQD